MPCEEKVKQATSEVPLYLYPNPRGLVTTDWLSALLLMH
jgi:hypothetical protein